MLAKIIGVLDVIPGWKVNIGSGGIVIAYLLGVAGVPAVYIGPLKEFCLAVITFGLAMKGARKMVAAPAQKATP